MVGRCRPSDWPSVAEHYEHFGGVSPINAQNRALIAALRAELDSHGLRPARSTGATATGIRSSRTPWRRWPQDGIRRALVVVTSAYSSYSSCRQYQDDLAAGAEAVGDEAPELDKIRHFFDHPGFIEPQVDAVRAAVAGLAGRRGAPPPGWSSPRTRSRRRWPSRRPACGEPVRPASSPRPRGLIAAGGARVCPGTWPSQSRSGPPAVPWLGPDISDQLRELAG